ncbi:MAG: hypothetical protein MZV63_53285 [Marinilabiliales bacterium]|nr:hypothetical protein [Marinilabiliales bacterium]
MTTISSVTSIEVGPISFHSDGEHVFVAIGYEPERGSGVGKACKIWPFIVLIVPGGIINQA